MPPFDGQQGASPTKHKVFCAQRTAVSTHQISQDAPFLDAVRNASHRQKGEVEWGTRLLRYRTAMMGHSDGIGSRC